MIDFAGMLAHARKHRQMEKQNFQLQEVVKDVPHLVQLPDCPSSVWYCDNFLEPSEAANIEHAIRTQHVPGDWMQLTKRRLLNLGGVPHSDGMIEEALPHWLQPLLDRLLQSGAFTSRPNQCLLNEYDERHGIDPHRDGPLFEPRAAVVSLCSSALLRFWEPHSDHKDPDAAVSSVLMRPGSLVVFSGHAYDQLYHGVVDASEEVIDGRTANRELTGTAMHEVISRGPRLSLTLRRVPKVAIPAGEFLQPSDQAEVARRRAWWSRAVSEKP